MALLASSPARAEIGGGVSISTDERFRSQSVSEGHPVASLDLSYDDTSGFYLAGSASVAIDRDSPELASVRGNLGYARNASPGVVADIGVVRAQYTRYYGRGYARHYTEIYAGVVAGPWSTHLHYSPDYLGYGSVFYADVDAVARPSPNWRLSAHAGLLLRTARTSAGYGQMTRYDLRAAATRRVGAIDLQLAWSRGGPGRDARTRRHDRGVIVAAASYSF